MTDQKGNKMDIPAKQKAGLVKGMTLHEKGKGLLEKDLRSALDFFLEADKGFNQWYVPDPFSFSILTPHYLASFNYSIL